MSQGDENQEKTQKTDAILMRPGNDPRRDAGQEKPPREHGQLRVERDGRLVPFDEAE